MPSNLPQGVCDCGLCLDYTINEDVFPPMVTCNVCGKIPKKTGLYVLPVEDSKNDRNSSINQCKR